jgi:hypothetical protein
MAVHLDLNRGHLSDIERGKRENGDHHLADRGTRLENDHGRSIEGIVIDYGSRFRIDFKNAKERNARRTPTIPS